MGLKVLQELQLKFCLPSTVRSASGYNYLESKQRLVRGKEPHSLTSTSLIITCASALHTWDLPFGASLWVECAVLLPHGLHRAVTQKSSAC
eukprot:2711842-Amphidinium_carterae.1